MSVRVGHKGGKSCLSGLETKGVSLMSVRVRDKGGMSVRVRKGGKSYVCQGSERG